MYKTTSRGGGGAAGAGSGGGGSGGSGSGILQVFVPTTCGECGARMVDLGDIAEELGAAPRPDLSGKRVCREVLAYAVELARRGDDRPVDHQMMRADGERWIREQVGVRERDTTLQ